MPPDSPLFGSHLSIAGNMSNALREAEGLTMDTVQVFTKNQRQWKVTALKDDARDEWLGESQRLGWNDARLVAHDSYLINLASPNDELWEKSVAMMREELDRAQALGIGLLVSHPGAHTGSGVEAGLERIAEAYKRLFAETRGSTVVLCLENTAGGGSTLGRTFEELATLKSLIEKKAGKDAKGRVGFCLDTCHALAAGYDIASTANGDGTGKKRTLAEGRKLGDGMLDEFDRVCGLKNLRVLHLNDSLGARGSNLDRHAHIGQGNVSLGAFKAVVNRPELRGVPMILETPKGEDEKGTPWDTVNLRKLRGLID
ncbi:MAG: deoxyribonuclease IV [Phycisphaerales bacterium]|nr:deoxyribonuclease IV [Phycisphaerales bacterium]